MTIASRTVRKIATALFMLAVPFVPLYAANCLYMRFIGYAQHKETVDPAPFLHTVFNYVHSFQLLLVVAVFGVLGLLIVRSVRGLWFSRNGATAPAHAVCIGQLALIVYVYLRSYLNHLIGAVIPITIVDVAAVIALLLCILYKRGEVVPAVKEIGVNRGDYLVTIYFIWLLLLVIANKELPRIAMLSSDSDQHAFFALQILRFHTLPFTQYYWGNQPPHYPGGFAVLNFLWSTISCLDVRAVVTAQRLVQTQLAILLLAECARAVVGPAVLKGRAYFAFLSLVFCIYYGVFPEGFETVFFSQEHTAIFSTLFFVTMVISFVFFVWMGRGNARYRESLNVPLNTAAVILIGAVLAVMHPAAALYAVIPCCLGLVLLWGGNRKWGDWIWIAAILPLTALPLLDPYYATFLSGFLSTGTPVGGGAGNGGFFPAFIAAAAGYFRGVQPILALFQTGLLDNALNMLLVAALVLAVLFACIRGSVQWRFLWLIVVSGFVLALSTVLLTGLPDAYADSVLRPGAGITAGAIGGPWQSNIRKVSFYITLHASRYTVLWVFLGAGVVLASFLSRLDRGKIALGVLVGVLALVIVSENHTEKVNIFLPRKYMSGSFEEVTSDDLAVIRRIEGRFRQYREAGGSLDYREVPRILILNEALVVDDRIWLFPRGASRILPLYDVFPVAFFYYQGMDWINYENYMRHVHDTFDREWLLEHNVRYLFLPSDGGNAVIDGLDSVVEDGKVIYEEGGCRFIELAR